jgi:hypothetical protein
MDRLASLFSRALSLNLPVAKRSLSLSLSLSLSFYSFFLTSLQSPSVVSIEEVTCHLESGGVAVMLVNSNLLTCAECREERSERRSMSLSADGV